MLKKTNKSATKMTCAQTVECLYRARLPLIVTTNLTLKELKNPDPLAKRRIYDRVLERCVPLQVNRLCIRQDNAAKVLKQVQASLK